MESLAQSISFQFDTAQVFQDADVGAMTFGDIDNDGDQDLLITGKGGPVLTTLYENDGSGNFTEITGLPFINVYGGAVEFADVDGDNDLDLIITGSTSSPLNTINLYLNDGVGGYSVATNTPFEAVAFGNIDVADIDDDGDQDLLITGLTISGTAITKLYRNDGSAMFTELNGQPFEALWSSAVEFLDIDNDTDLDLLMCGTNSNDVPLTLLYSNNGAGAFTLIADTPFDHIDQGDIAYADCDNDGDTDILLCGKNDQQQLIAKLYLNNGMGEYSFFPGTPFPGTLIGASSFADFDNDGDFDVLHVGTGPGGLADNSIIANVYENTGSNNFILADSLIGAYFASTAIADVNGDNKLDVVIAGTTTGSPVRATRLYTNTSIFSGITVQQPDDHHFQIFPNPTNRVIQIRSAEFLNAKIAIFNTLGNLVYSGDFTGINQQIIVDLADGIYFLTISYKDRVFTQKLILEK